MSAIKWSDVKDFILETIKVDEITEELKNNVAKSIIEEVIPAIKERVAEVKTELLKQGAEESGWVRIRDAYLYPLLLNVALYAVEKVLEKSLDS